MVRKGGGRFNTRRSTIKKLEDAGFRLLRNGANHDIYRQTETGKQIPVKRHNFDEQAARYILKEAGLK